MHVSRLPPYIVCGIALPTGLPPPAMPRFFFHVYDDVVARDEEGVELADSDAARTEAVRGARSLACEQVLSGRLDLSHRVEVEDDTGAHVATIEFRDVIAVAG